MSQREHALPMGAVSTEQSTEGLASAYARPLEAVTKVTIIMWGAVTLLGGLLMIFWEPFATTVVVPSPPLERIPVLNAGFYGALAAATGVASAYALWRNRWAFAAPVIAMYLADAILQEIVAVRHVLSGGAIPPQIIFYMAYGVVFLVLIYFIYRKQGSI
jgi:hypothetical protein